MTTPHTPIPQPVEDEPTGRTKRMTGEIIRAGQDLGVAGPKEGEDELTTIFRQLRDQLNGGGTNGKPPSKVKSWSLTAVVALLGSLAAGFGTYKAYQAKVDSNEASIIEHKAEPMHPAAAKEYQEIKTKVDKVEHTLDDVKTGQAAIVTGLNALKQDKLDGLERERDKLERELAREKRRNR